MRLWGRGAFNALNWSNFTEIVLSWCSARFKGLRFRGESVRVTEVRISESRKYELKATTLSKLGGLVIVAGANGAGKSRLLRVIQEKLTSAIQSDNGVEIFFDLPGGRMSETRIQFADIVPDGHPLYAISENPPADIVANAGRARNLHALDLSVSALAYTRNLLDNFFNFTHQNFPVSEQDSNEATRKWNTFKDLVQRFLGVELDCDKNRNPTLAGSLLETMQLSDGQRKIYKTCVQLHAQDMDLEGLVLFLDEPENHMHAQACIEWIQAIRKNAPNTQVWIATHSVPLVASFADEATLLYAEDSKISFAGSAPEKVLRSLLGGKESIEKIKEFVGLPDVLAINRYTAQCLHPPLVAHGAGKDDQTTQIRNVLQGISGQSKRVLDIGAGKGRLIANLHHSDSEISHQIDYVAFDPFCDHSDECRAMISNAFGNSEGRYVSDLAELQRSGCKNRFDVAVFCNVLHEIPPEGWDEYFGSDGVLEGILSDNGYLLIVEDELIPVGERAHDYGFLVLGTEELKTLFNIEDNSVGFLVNSMRSDDRLKAHLIPKIYVSNYTHDRRKQALEARKESALKKLGIIRNSDDKSFRKGRDSAFYLQQFANAELAIRSLYPE